MRNILLEEVDSTPRRVVAIGTDYEQEVLLTRHKHRRAQLLYGITGLMEVETDDGAWVIPPYNAVWIPAEKPHQVRMKGVSTRSLYIEGSQAPRQSISCEVLVINPLLHQLLLASADIPAYYNEQGRDGAVIELLLYEINQAATRDLFAPIPKDKSLARICRLFLAAPSIVSTPEEWAERMHKSLRSFSRFFKQETGMTFREWRQQACLMAAISQLTAKKSVTQVAFDLGYESYSAFSTMFRARLGISPQAFQKQLFLA